LANTSGRRLSGGHVESGTAPVNSHISRMRMDSGTTNSRTSRSAKAPSMKLCQSGAAPVLPEMAIISELSLLPTHTPAARSGV